MTTRQKIAGGSNTWGRHGGSIIRAPPLSSTTDGHDRVLPRGTRFQTATAVCDRTTEADLSGVSWGRSRGKVRQGVQGAEQSANTLPTATPPKQRKGRGDVQESDNFCTWDGDLLGEESGTGSEAASIAGEEPFPAELPRWRIPHIRRLETAEEVAEVIFAYLESLDRLRVKPAYRNTPGVKV